MSTLAPSSPPPSTICVAYLHLELSFIILLLLQFLVVIAGGLVDRAEEASVADIEVVACTELIPPVLERCAHFIVHDGPIQAHETGLPSHCNSTTCCCW